MIYYSHYIAYTFGSHDYVCKKKNKKWKIGRFEWFSLFTVSMVTIQ